MTTLVDRNMSTSAVRSTSHSSIASSLIAQTRFAAIVYPALMGVAFIGAVTAAYVNPHLLDPVPPATQVETAPPPTEIPVLPASPVSAPAGTQGETLPLVSQVAPSRVIDGITGAVVSTVNEGRTEASAAMTSSDRGMTCEVQKSPTTGDVLGRTCTPYDINTVGVRPQ